MSNKKLKKKSTNNSIAPAPNAIRSKSANTSPLRYITAKKEIDRSAIKQKLDKLETIKVRLKKDFVGIDSQIDQMVESIKVWYIFPETLSKPLIVNLWGITGTFKTSVVRRFIELLEIRTFKEIDARRLPTEKLSAIIGMGRNIDDPSTVLPEVFLLDEFQNIRTISNRGDDTETSGELYELFSWLSDGKVKYTRSSYSHSKLLNLAKAMENSKASVIADIEKIRTRKLEQDPDMTIAEALFDAFYYVFDDYFVFNSENIFKFENDIDKLFDYVIKQTAKLSLDFTLDLSKSLIFIAGNVDEAFSSLAFTMDNDMLTPDQFYAVSSQVNFNVIKESLLYRFKPEQVARLGTNHVIFPSFNTKMYTKLIHNLNKRTIGKFKRFGIKIHIDETVIDYILKHAAVPSQGARSVLSAHEYLVDSNIPEALATSLLNKGKNVTIAIKEDNVLIITNKNIIVKEITIIDKNVLENYSNEDLNRTISLHEAAHAVCGIALMGIMPDVVKTRLSNGEIGGYCKFTPPERLMNREEAVHMIAIKMAGYAGEVMRNGFEKLSTGTSSDIMSATHLASVMTKILGLGSSVAAKGFSMMTDALVLNNTDEMDSETESLVEEGLFLAFNCLSFYDKEHKQLTKILMNQTTTKAKDIEHLF